MMSDTLATKTKRIPTVVKSPLPGRMMSGMEALLEGMLAHRRQDQGLNTATFVSGYRGSPLGAFDSLMWQQKKALAEAGITFKPGLNEDLAATACWGTQQLALMEGPTKDGVTAFWYGKGPGVDRSGDVLKHANVAGTMPLGGVVMIVGDDHGAKSSTVAHQSDQALIAAGIPVLYPATIQEYADLLPAAVAMSRHAGLWVAFKCVTETIEGSCLVSVQALPVPWVYPEVARPAGGFHIGSQFQPAAMEKILMEYRLPAAQAFVTANHLDRIVLDAPTRGLGIVAPGKSFIDVMEALRLLGLEEGAAALGIRIFKPLMVWPLARQAIADFCRGHREILVVEEKRSLVEEQLAGILLRMEARDRPILSGKLDPAFNPLLADYGELDSRAVAKAIGGRLRALGLASADLEARMAALFGDMPATGKPIIPRTPAFCSGCPHNRSTQLPDGSMAFGGIGCHGMALFVPELRTPAATQMGGEGANWIGLTDYVATKHVFQNLGEGTYAHSGVLAIRAAIAAKVNITYKILFNSATAMTGGQPVEGEFTADDLAWQLSAEGVHKIVLLTEYPTRRRKLPAGVVALPRTELETVQRELREFKGVTALIYEQGCAAERRRLRKKKAFPDPAVRTYINPEVCEGCGDCGRKSNCVSLVPVESEFGLKRGVDQESCNKDYTCIEGFCPSFVTVKGGAPKVNKIDAAMADTVAAALVGHEVKATADTGNILIAGIGGSGTISLGATLAKAALANGKRVSVFDVTGLAQKNGPVYSHLRIVPGEDERAYQPRIPTGQLDVLIGCDIAGSAAPTVLPLTSPDRTSAYINHHLVPVAAFQRNPDLSISTDDYVDALAMVLPPSRLEMFAPGERASRLLGQGALMNIALAGYALQRGAIPIDAELIEAAMVRGGGPDIPSIFALRLGRLLAIDPHQVEIILGGEMPPQPRLISELPLEAAIARCKEILTDYQSIAYADQFEASVRSVQGRDPHDALTQSYAVNLFKLMRYKDEYEVARLYAAPAFMDGLRKDFSGDLTLNFNLAPPLLAFRKTADGEPRKIKFGPWVYTLFKVLKHLKVLRGTPFDLFGWSHDRKVERMLIKRYKGWIQHAITKLNDANYATAVAIAELPALIRGYGPVKDRNVKAVLSQYETLAARL